jgi:hypothetical protein
MIAAALLLTAACSNSPNSVNSPSRIPQTNQTQLEQALDGTTWQGTTVCDDDHHTAGLNVTFGVKPGEGQDLNADLTWTDFKPFGVSVAYHGHVQGTLSNMTIVATDLNGCNYKAQGSATDTTITGAYQAIGNCPKNPNTGTFSLVKQ